MPKTSSKRWPESPLTAAERAFELLTCPPDPPLVFDARGVTGLPQRSVPLDELRRLLISDATSRPVRDQVWRDLVIRARHEGSAWVVAAVGVAMPGCAVPPAGWQPAGTAIPATSTPSC